MKIIKTFMKIVHTKYIFFISRAKTRRRAGVPWAMLEPNKIFAVPYRHGPTYLTCLVGMTKTTRSTRGAGGTGTARPKSHLYAR